MTDITAKFLVSNTGINLFTIDHPALVPTTMYAVRADVSYTKGTSGQEWSDEVYATTPGTAVNNYRVEDLPASAITNIENIKKDHFGFNYWNSVFIAGADAVTIGEKAAPILFIVSGNKTKLRLGMRLVSNEYPLPASLLYFVVTERVHLKGGSITSRVTNINRTNGGAASDYLYIDVDLTDPFFPQTGGIGVSTIQVAAMFTDTALGAATREYTISLLTTELAAPLFQSSITSLFTAQATGGFDLSTSVDLVGDPDSTHVVVNLLNDAAQVINTIILPSTPGAVLTASFSSVSTEHETITFEAYSKNDASVSPSTYLSTTPGTLAFIETQIPLTLTAGLDNNTGNILLELSANVDATRQSFKIERYASNTVFDDSAIGGYALLGSWNPATNTPNLPLPFGNDRYKYTVSAPGTHNGITYVSGDWVVSDGSAWVRVPVAAQVAPTKQCEFLVPDGTSVIYLDPALPTKNYLYRAYAVSTAGSSSNYWTNSACTSIIRTITTDTGYPDLALCVPTFTQGTDGTIALQWKAGHFGFSGLGSYIIKRSEYPTNSYTLAETVLTVTDPTTDASGFFHWVDEPLLAKVNTASYYYFLNATGANGYQPQSGPVAFTNNGVGRAYPVDVAPPAPVSGALSVKMGVGQATISWTPNSEADLYSYMLQFAADGTTFVALDETDSTPYTHISDDYAKTSVTAYRYQIKAKDTGGHLSTTWLQSTAGSTSTTGYVPSSGTAPSAPSAVVATRGNNADFTITITPPASTLSPVATYRIVRRKSTGSTGEGSIDAELSVAANGTTAVVAHDSGLLVSQTSGAAYNYKYYVYSINALGVSSTSYGTSGALQQIKDTTPPAFPVSNPLSAVAHAGNVILTVNCPTAEPLCDIELWRHTAAINLSTTPDISSTALRVFEQHTPSNVLPTSTYTMTFTDVEVDMMNPVAHWYWVRAIDRNNNASAFISYPNPTFPASIIAMQPGYVGVDTTVPIISGATPRFHCEGDGSITLSWSAASAGTIANYVIKRSSTTDAIAQAIVVAQTGNARGWTDTIAINKIGSTYFYWLDAVTTQGVGAAAPQQFLSDVSPFTAHAAVTIDSAPAMPTNLSAVAGNGNCTIKWDPIKDLDLWKYSLDFYNGSSWTNAFVSTDGASYVHTGTDFTKDKNTAATYQYRITSFDARSNASGTTSAVTIDSNNYIPFSGSTPAALTAAPVASVSGLLDGSIKLTITATANALVNQFHIVRYKDGVIDSENLIPFNTSAVYMDMGLDPGKTYYYTVANRSTAGIDSDIKTSNSVQPIDTTVPAAPTISGVAQSGSKLITVVGPIEAKLTVEIYRSTGAIFVPGTAIKVASYLTSPSASITADVTFQFSDQEVNVNSPTQHTYAARCTDFSGNPSAGWSSSVTVISTRVTIPSVAVPDISGCAPKFDPKGDGSILLTWSQATGGDVANYIVKRSTGTVESAAIVVASASTTLSWLDTSSVNGTAKSYCYWLTAISTSGISCTPVSKQFTSLSGSTTVATTQDSAPNNVAGLAAVTGNGNCALSWTPGTDLDLAYYLLEFSTNAGSSYSTLIQTAGTSFTHTGTAYAAASIADYRYRVSAKDRGGNSSAVSTAVTPPAGTYVPFSGSAPAPLTTAPSASVLGLTDGSIKLTITATANPLVNQFHVIRYKGGVLDAENLIPFSTSTVYTDMGLDPGSSYNYSVANRSTAGVDSSVLSSNAVTPRDTDGPVAPVPAATPQPGSKKVTVTAPVEKPVTVEIYKDGQTNLVASFLSSTASQVFVYVDQEADIQHPTTSSYYARAIDKSGNPSAWSSAVSATSTVVTIPNPTPGFAGTNLIKRGGLRNFKLGSSAGDTNYSRYINTSAGSYTVTADPTAMNGISALLTSACTFFVNSSAANSYQTDAVLDAGEDYVFSCYMQNPSGTSAAVSASPISGPTVTWYATNISTTVYAWQGWQRYSVNVKSASRYSGVIGFSVSSAVRVAGMMLQKGTVISPFVEHTLDQTQGSADLINPDTVNQMIADGSLWASKMVISNYDNMIQNAGSELAPPAGQPESAPSFNTSMGYHGTTRCREIVGGGEAFVTPYIAISPVALPYFEAQVYGGSTTNNKSIFIEAYNNSKVAIGSRMYPGAAVPITADLSSPGWYKQVVRTTGAALPWGTAYIRAGIWSNVTAQFDDFYMRLQNNGMLVVDGTINANTGIFGTLNADTMSAINIDVSQLKAGDLSADRIVGGTLNIGNVLVSGSLSFTNLANNPWKLGSGQDIQSNNYAPYTAVYTPPVGFRISAVPFSSNVVDKNGALTPTTVQAVFGSKVQIGAYELGDLVLRSMQSLDAPRVADLTATSAVFYRGNSAPGAGPNGACLSIGSNAAWMMAAAGVDDGNGIWTTTAWYSWTQLNFTIQPTATIHDNLDGLRYIEVNSYSTAGVLLETFYVPCTDRLYVKTDDHSNPNNATRLSHLWMSRRKNSENWVVTAILGCRLWNVYGCSDMYYFAPTGHAAGDAASAYTTFASTLTAPWAPTAPPPPPPPPPGGGTGVGTGGGGPTGPRYGPGDPWYLLTME